MPRKDRETNRGWLRHRLLECGFSAEEASQEIRYFSAPHVTSTDLFAIEQIVSKVQRNLEAEKQRVAEALEDEKRARQRMVAAIREIPEQIERTKTEEVLARFMRWLAEHPPA